MHAEYRPFQDAVAHGVLSTDRTTVRKLWRIVSWLRPTVIEFGDTICWQRKSMFDCNLNQCINWANELIQITYVQDFFKCIYRSNELFEIFFNKKEKIQRDIL